MVERIGGGEERGTDRLPSPKVAFRPVLVAGAAGTRLGFEAGKSSLIRPFSLRLSKRLAELTGVDSPRRGGLVVEAGRVMGITGAGSLLLRVAGGMDRAGRTSGSELEALPGVKAGLPE